MKIYSSFGFNEFIICLGYKGYVIKEYFANYFLHMADVTFDVAHNQMEIHSNNAEPFKVTLVETGLHTMTGGRLLRVKDYLSSGTFMMTYGDGVTNVNVIELLRFHKQKKQVATLTAVQPTGRFGALKIDQDHNITRFREKPEGDGAWINGGFLCSNLRYLTILKMMPPYLKENLWRVLLPTANSMPIITTASGWPWIN
ncbi:MAG: hypothetical protein IEMM0006_1608 [bacterium]|nr:MAG: hypothetical protein IEMM0006_1608 [bacterium]